MENLDKFISNVWMARHLTVFAEVPNARGVESSLLYLFKACSPQMAQHVCNVHNASLPVS